MTAFGAPDWDVIRQSYRKWWNGELGRPIFPIVFYGREPGREPSKNPILSFANCADFSFTPEQIIDRFDYDFRCCEYAGEGCPIVPMHAFGPGVGAAFLGCELNNRPDTVWFEAREILPISEIHFEYNPGNLWLRRVKDIYCAGMEKWGSDVIMGMTDIGGVLDILASFRTSERLLTDLYDQPDEVLRCVNEIQTMWFKFFDEINDIIRPYANGYSSWAAIYSERPSYMLQSDFAYMISPKMFAQFVAPELYSSGGRLYKPFYHLDGIGQLPHLDQILAMDTISGIQWVPGDGEPAARDWSELYGKITRAGKKIQAYGAFDANLDKLLGVMPSPDMLVTWQMSFPLGRKDEIKRSAYKYGLEI